jgi:hypothetical protein
LNFEWLLGSKFQMESMVQYQTSTISLTHHDVSSTCSKEAYIFRKNHNSSDIFYVNMSQDSEKTTTTLGHDENSGAQSEPITSPPNPNIAVQGSIISPTSAAQTVSVVKTTGPASSSNEASSGIPGQASSTNEVFLIKLRSLEQASSFNEASSSFLQV